MIRDRHLHSRSMQPPTSEKYRVSTLQISPSGFGKGRLQIGLNTITKKKRKTMFEAILLGSLVVSQISTDVLDQCQWLKYQFQSLIRHSNQYCYIIRNIPVNLIGRFTNESNIHSISRHRKT